MGLDVASVGLFCYGDTNSCNVLTPRGGRERENAYIKRFQVTFRCPLNAVNMFWIFLNSARVC